MARLGFYTKNGGDSSHLSNSTRWKTSVSRGIDHTVGNCCTTFDGAQDETSLSTLESKIQDLRKKGILQGGSYAAHEIKKTKGRGRDSNPRRGLHRAIG